MTASARTVSTRTVWVVCFVCVVACATAACPPHDGALGVFEGGHDPVRYDAGTLPPLPAHVAEAKPLRFNIPPFYADKLSEGAVRDLDAWLERETGLAIEIAAPPAYSYTEIAGALARGDVDLAELSPYQFALMTQRANTMRPLAATVAHGASTYGSYIVVRQDSPIATVDDLRGKKIAFVDPLSTSGYLLPAAFLRARGFDLDRDVQISFVGSHPNALAAVKNGDVDAAAVSSDLLIGQAGLAGPLVVVAKAGRMPYDAIVARADLPDAVFARVQAALFRLSIHTQEGRAALRAFSSVDGFMPIPPGHYDGVIDLARSPPPSATGTAPRVPP